MKFWDTFPKAFVFERKPSCIEYISQRSGVFGWHDLLDTSQYSTDFFPVRMWGEIARQEVLDLDGYGIPQGSEGLIRYVEIEAYRVLVIRLGVVLEELGESRWRIHMKSKRHIDEVPDPGRQSRVFLNPLHRKSRRCKIGESFEVRDTEESEPNEIAEGLFCLGLAPFDGVREESL